MERRPFGRDWGLSCRMAVCLCLLALLYLPFFLWIVGFAYFIWGLSGALIAGVGALGLLASAPYLSERLALSLARSDAPDQATTDRVLPILERLCVLADMPVPRVGLVPTDLPNAFSAGRSPKNATIVVTRGLLDRLDDAELEAVLAHELAHIANRDAFVMTIAAAPAMLGRKLIWGFTSLPFTSPEIGTKIISAIAVLYMLPLLFVGWVVYAFATLLVMSISRYREFVADRGGAIMTGAPEQLMSALQKIADAFPVIPERDLRDAMRMNAFFVLPAEGSGNGFEVDPLRIFPTHPPLQKRLARLAAYARDLGRSRAFPAADEPVPLALPPSRPAGNPQAVASFFFAVLVWGSLAGVLATGTELVEGMLWVSLLSALALAAGIFFAFQGIGRASAGAGGMGYAVAGLALLLGPWVLAFLALIVFMALAAVGVGPVG